MLRARDAREFDRGQHFIVGQHVLAGRILLGQREEIRGRERAFARRADDAELRVERHQRRRGVRRMHDEAGSAAEDRVELVLAGDREALIAAGFVARETVAEIPAPRALADVAGQRADVADLRRRDALGRFGQHRVLRSNQRVAAERIERDQAADVSRRSAVGVPPDPVP